MSVVTGSHLTDVVVGGGVSVGEEGRPPVRHLSNGKSSRWLVWCVRRYLHQKEPFFYTDQQSRNSVKFLIKKPVKRCCLHVF